MNFGEISSIVITGCLGGLGSTLAREFLKSGKQVFGIDNFDPGCASILHHRFVREELEKNDSFSFLAHDIRRTLPSDFLPQKGRFLWFHCVDYTPSRNSYFDPVTADEVLCQSIEKQISGFAEDFHFVFQHIFNGMENSRLNHPEWLIVLELNQKLRTNCSESENVQFIPLPLLMGKYQSRHTLPLKMFLQFNSGIPIEIHPNQLNIQAVDLDKYVTGILDGLNDNMLMPSEENIVVINQDSVLGFLQGKFPEDEIETKKTIICWGPSSEKEVDLSILQTKLEEIYGHMESIPHYPPNQWAREMKREEKERRAIRRRQHRRRKKNRTN